MPARSMPSPQGRQDRDAQLQQAQALMVKGNLQAAEDLYRQLLDAGVENAGLLSNLAVICWQSDRHGEMEQLLRRALRLQPRHASAHYNLALVLAQRGAGAEAIDHYRQALPLAASELQGSIHWNLSKLLLRQGDYAEGWEHYEWRRHKARPLPPICPPGMPAWDGRSPIADQLVLVGEQGLGDMLQFLRYAPAMGAYAPQVALCLPEKLHGVVRSSGLAVSLLRPAEARAQRHGVWLPLLSAPALLGVRPEAVQVEAPYLQVPADRVEHWRQHLRAGLPAEERLVAIHWQGDPATETSELRGRSLPLQWLAPLARIQGVRLVSLQKGPGSEQLAGSAIAQRLVPCQAVVDSCWDFVETGAIALACDLVISTDSALVHLAGGLGAPTWLLLHHTSDWRWGEQGDSTFWYPSMRLFRQQWAGDWGEVIERVVASLASTWGTPRHTPEERQQQALHLLQQQRTAEAEAIYRQLLEEGQATATACANLGAICGASGRPEEAVPLLEQALQLDPHHLSALANLAEAHCQQGCWEEAEPLLRRALEHDPNHLQALNRLGDVARELGQHDHAIALRQRAVELVPAAPEAHVNLGLAYGRAEHLEEACASYRQALALRPGYADAEANLSTILLQLGDYQGGLALREARLRKSGNPVVPIVQPALPRWQPGQAEPLLVVGEQGLGDMLQFLRYVPVLQQTQRDLWLCLPPPLIDLARVSGLAPRVITPEEWEAGPMPQRPSQWVPLLSLAWHLGVTPQQPLVDAPYLQSTPHSRRSWRQRICATTYRAVVALHWQGNREHGHLLGRSLPLERLAPLAELEGIELLSLQKGYGSEQLQACSFRQRFLSCQPEVEDCWSFVDTAAMVQACDLVITTDSAIGHLAGALGAPTWLLLHHPPDWRWGLEGDSTFWYPSMRLFRQQQRGNWPAVIERVKLELQSWLACRRSL